MRIGIDAHAIGSRLGGNETYIAGLLFALGWAESPHEFVAYFTSEAAAEPWRGRYANIAVRVFKMPSLPRLLAELPIRAAADRLDLLHVQYVAPPIRSVPAVAMIHDICYEFLPQFFSRPEVIQFRIAIRWTARHARRILTVSETSKQDIVNIYGVPSSRIDVTYNGVDLTRFQPDAEGSRVDATLARYGIKRPYILAVGNLQPRKNLVRLIDAFVDLKRQRPELPHSLVLVGKAAFQHSEVFNRAREHGLNDQIFFTGYVPSEDLPVLYQGAAVFAYPSFYEGFGLPVVEAMACGIPVLTSDRGSLPEVTGEAAILINPEDSRAITDGLIQALTDTDKSANLSSRGLQRARNFTWGNTARTTLAAFEAAIQKDR